MVGSLLHRHHIGRRLVACAIGAVGLAYADPYVVPDSWTDLPAAEVRPGGELHYPNNSDPRTFSPLKSVEANMVVAMNTDPNRGAAVLAWERPDDGRLVPRAAESWTVSEDHLTVDVTLRPELRWSDGEQITAQDYLISFQLETNPETGAYGPEAWQIDGEMVEVEATGPMTLQVRFPKADRLSLRLLQGLYPLPDRIFGEAFRTGGAEAVNALWGIDTPPSELVVSGYMRLVEFAPGERMVFERNPHFGTWNVDAAGRPLPYVDSLRFTTLSAATELSMFLSGELDTFIPSSLDDIGLIKRAVAQDGLDANVIESGYSDESLFFITFNWNLASDPFRQALFREREFRRAMAHLVDREGIIELVHAGAGFPLKVGVNPSLRGWFDEDLEVPGFDPDQAASLLAGLGFKQRDSSGYLVDAEGRRLSFSLSLAAGVPIAEGTATLFADAARQVGVEVKVQPLAFPLLVEMITTQGDDRPFEAMLIGLSGADRTWPLNEGIYSCTGALHLYNLSGTCLFPTELLMSELVKRGRYTLDDEEAIRIAHEVQALEADLSAVLYTTSSAVHYVASGRLAGHYPPELHNSRNGFGLPFLTSVR